MSDNDKATKAVRGTKNIVYSVLVFFALFCTGVAILDPSALNNASGEPKLSAGSLIAFGLSAALTVMFSMWFSNRQNRR